MFASLFVFLFSLLGLTMDVYSLCLDLRVFLTCEDECPRLTCIFHMFTLLVFCGSSALRILINFVYRFSLLILKMRFNILVKI